jgi:DNA replication protein DnaC
MSADANLPNGLTCPICGGSGWREVRHGQDKRVTRCSCTVHLRAEFLVEKAGIPARYSRAELSNFKTSGRQRSLEQALLKARAFVEQYPLDKTGLLLYGPSGTGKTHIAVGIIRELIESKGVWCIFCDYSELLKEIQNSYNPTVETTELEILRPILDSEVLVLDDLGSVRRTDWVWDAVSLILNHRYNQSRTTIITTNYSDGPSAKAQGIEGPRRAVREETLGDRIGDRMRSRIHEMCRIINFPGEAPDFRDRATAM